MNHDAFTKNLGATFKAGPLLAGVAQSRAQAGARRSQSLKVSRGFTLIELLVVIAVIAILAAILFPVFARARENARRTSCQSNMKQMGLALMQYSQDYDEILIADWYGPVNNPGPSSPATGEYKWMDASFPYTKSEQIFTCPSDSRANSKFTQYEKVTAPSLEYGSYNIVHGYGPNVVGRTPPVSHPRVGDLVLLAEMATPSTTAWVIDGKDGFFVQAGLGSIVNEDPRTMNNAIERHLNTINVLFCDGHVKAIKLEALGATNSDGVWKLFTLEDD